MEHHSGLARVREALSHFEPDTSAPPLPRPRLAHVVLNVPDVQAALDFYTGFLGYVLVTEDRQLGVYFLSAGDDHHTIALGECLPSGPSALLRLHRMLPRLAALVKARFSDDRSSSGQRRVLPSLSAIRMALRPGLQHIGFRVDSEADLKRMYETMKTRGIPVRWSVNHGDMIKGLYVDDGNGNMVEIFADGARGRETLDLARRAGGFHAFRRLLDRVGAPDDLPSYDLDPETEL